jgi:hypothetical protein
MLDWFPSWPGDAAFVLFTALLNYCPLHFVSYDNFMLLHDVDFDRSSRRIMFICI